MWFKLVVFVISIHVTISTTDQYQIPDVYHFDDYDDCLYQNSNESFTYCTVTVQIYPKSLNSSKIWDPIKRINSDSNHFRHDLLRRGICTTKRCQNPYCLNQKFELDYQNLGLKTQILDLSCETQEPRYAFTTSDIIFISILVTYIIFVLLVSICLQISRNIGQKQASQVEKVLSAFSLFDNISYLVSKKPDNFIFFVQGIRFVTSIGVIVTHATLTNIVVPVKNPSYVEEVPKRLITMVLANGGMTVQVLFVCSAWLMAIGFYEKLKTEEIKFGYIVRKVVQKYIRLTVGHALIIALHSTVMVHLSRGPFWDQIIGEDYRVCQKNWWKNLLCFNNFDIDSGLCLFQSWYLAVEFQFTVLGLLILWITQKRPRNIFLVLGLLITFQIIFMFCYLLWNEFEIAVVFKPEILYNFKFFYIKEWQATWTTTYSNLGGLAVGLCFGYLYTEHKQVFTKTHRKILWWVVSWVLFLGPLLFSSYYMTTGYYSHSKWFAAAYGSVNKLLFVLGIGFLIFGMSQRLGGYVKTILEWRPMHTLAQLSFGVYLIHYTLLKFNVASRIQPLYLTDYLMFSEVIMNVAASYLCSVALTLFVLMPVNVITKILF